MRRMHAAMTLLLLLAATVSAGEKRQPLLRTRSTKSQEIQTAVLQAPAGDPLPPPVGQVIPAPATPAPVVTDPFNLPIIGTPVVDVTAPTSLQNRAVACPSGLLGGHRKRPETPRPAVECLGCSSLRCEFRFLLGGCRAFFEEGPFKPTYPDNCPWCDR